MAPLRHKLTYFNLKSLLIPKKSPSVSFARMCSSPSPTDIDSFVRLIYEQVHPSSKFSVHLTGGGTLAIPWLFTVPGASNCLLEGSVPYAAVALRGLIGKNPAQYCSAHTASDMAQAALRRNVSYLLADSGSFPALANTNVFAVSCTASLVSQMPKKGPHRCFVGLASSSLQAVTSVEMRKGRNGRSRASEDNVCSRMVLDAIGRCCNLPLMANDYLFSEPGSDGEAAEQMSVIDTHREQEDYIRDLLEGRAESVLVVPTDGPTKFKYYHNIDIPSQTLIFPGSFNPIHDGHVLFAAAASIRLKKQEELNADPLFLFELSVANADKPPLSIEDVLKRLELFSRENPIFQAHGLANYALCLTTRSLFLGKTELFRGCTFLIGSDTMVRLLDPKYYNNSHDEMIVALSTIRERDCAFIVGGRVEQWPLETVSSGSTEKDTPETLNFLTCEHVLAKQGECLPESVRNLFQGLSENEFRNDLSSTAIRRGLSSNEMIGKMTR